MMPLIFVVDPSPERRGVVQRALEQAGYPVEVFATTRAIESAEQKFPSLIIVAVELPDGNAILLREKVRENAALIATTVVMLADCRLDHRGAIQNFGAQDTFVFPFAPGELLKSVENMLQRTGASSSHSLKAADIVIDPYAMKVFVRGKEITTTSLEFRLLDYLARHQGKVFSRDALLDAVWGDLRFVTPRSVDACIRRIRRKIEPESCSPQFLRTIRGTGYKLDARPAWEVGGACECAICKAAKSRGRAVSPQNFETKLNSAARAAFPH
jgi:DNA-binding response OmpR family regulator